MRRSQSYIEAFGADVRLTRQAKEISDQIKAEGDRYAALQELLQKERETLQKVEESFRVRQSANAVGAALLADQLKAQIERGKAFQAGKVAVAKSKEVPAAAQGILDKHASATAGSRNTAAAAARLTEIMKDPKLTAESRAAILAGMKISNFPATTVSAAEANSAGIRRELAKTPGAFTPEQEDQFNKFQVALDALTQEGETGYVGGESGAAAANARSKEDSADLSKYLEALTDGTATVDEFAGDADALFRARAVYNRAKADGSFQRQDRKFFEPTWLQQAAAIAKGNANLEAAAASGAIKDPAAEAERRKLIARGIDPDDRHWQLKGTPDYDYATGADRIIKQVMDAGVPLEAANDWQIKTKDLIRQFDASGKEWGVEDLESNLKRVVRDPKELKETIAWAIAYDELAKMNATSPDQIAEQKQFAADQAAGQAAEIEARRVEAEAASAKLQEDRAKAYAIEQRIQESNARNAAMDAEDDAAFAAKQNLETAQLARQTDDQLFRARAAQARRYGATSEEAADRGTEALIDRRVAMEAEAAKPIDMTPPAAKMDPRAAFRAKYAELLAAGNDANAAADEAFAFAGVQGPAPVAPVAPPVAAEAKPPTVDAPPPSKARKPASRPAQKPLAAPAPPAVDFGVMVTGAPSAPIIEDDFILDASGNLIPNPNKRRR